MGMFFKAFIALIASLPEILQLIKSIQRQEAIKAKKVNVKQSVSKIKEAFESKDADALNKIFNGR